ncbi:MAG TPA: NAD(P)H-hydrate dehydratase [Candidatus Eisenbacteria bacterium]|nr:NAD(P)H-hydrate dehydratase [Candidatus Eisenbacteria bacterium]
MLLVTAAEMRALDDATITGGHATGEALMERAGRGVADAMERRYGSPLAMRVLVVCGVGNNGGDGFVAARHLRARGAVTTAGIAGARARVKGDALAHLRRLEQDGVRVAEWPDEAALRAAVAAFDHWDFALDAVLGTGARGAPESVAAVAVQVMRELDDGGTRVVAVDLPTGVDADTGAVARRAVRADLTVTFGCAKRGHVLYPGRAFAGALEVVDIGLAPPPADAAGFRFQLATAAGIADLLPVRDPRAHKGSTGRVLVVGGSRGLSGAPAMVARAATRAGAGYVQLAVPEAIADLLAIKLWEQMPFGVAGTSEGGLAASAFDAIAERAQRADVVALGPGMWRGDEAAALARRLVRELDRPIVLDADGINAFAGHVDELANARARVVLTPHLMELSRLTGVAVDAIEATRLDTAREWAGRTRSALVLKGAPTVTASPDGTATVNATGNAGLATAGTGDVLTGVIAALIGQGLSPYDSARAGVYVHGLAGDRAAAARGAIGLQARDVVEELPLALQTLARVRDEQLERRARRQRPAG